MPAPDRSPEDRRLDGILAALSLLDVVLAIWALAFPALWFAAFHGTGLDDPEGLVRRCGANWAAYALFQIVTLVRWRRGPEWIAIVAGLRFGDIFTDWTYLGFAHHTTWFGKAALFVASPTNLAIGLFLLAEYRRRKGPRSLPAAPRR